MPVLHPRTSFYKESGVNYRIRWTNILLHAQVGVYTWDLRFGHGLWEGREPAFRPPLQCVLAQDGFVAVRRENANDDSRVFWNKDLVNNLAIQTPYGLRER